LTALCVMADFDITEEERRRVQREWPANIDLAFTAGMSEPERAKVLDRAQVLVTWASGMDRPTVEAGRQLQLLHSLGHGIDPLLEADVRPILRDRALRVATADTSDVAIAEYAVMAMIMLSRQAVKMHNALAFEGVWRPVRGFVELRGSTLCVVGFGSIGQQIAKVAEALGVRVVAATRNPTKHAGHPAVQDVRSFAQLAQVVTAADFVVAAAPLTRDTMNLFDAAMFDRMKPGSFFVNVGRGGLVEEEALFDALASGRLAGAAVDAWRDDRRHRWTPGRYPSPFPLHQFNVLMTPHCSGASEGRMARAVDVAGQNIARFMAGEPLMNEIALHELEEMAEAG
jgi:phosphoglycerate dehydrogenase-like enzyme